MKIRESFENWFNSVLDDTQYIPNCYNDEFGYHENINGEVITDNQFWHITELFDCWIACDNHKEAEIAELKEKLRLHQTRLEEEREQMKTFGLILNHALQGKKHPKESDNDSRMQAIRDLREQALK